MRLVFFGSGAFGLPTLQSLADQHDIAAIITQPDRPSGRGGSVTPTPIGEYAAKTLPNTPLFKPEKVNQLTEQIRNLNADAWVIIAFGQKLGAKLLDGIFAINLHASLLPRWRGAAPINAAILAGDTQSGNSIITLADRMDAGLILAQSHRDIEPADTAGDLHDLLADDGPELVESVLQEHAKGTVRLQSQDESLVTIAPKFSKADGWVDFTQDAESCRRRIQGLTPWPGVTVQFRDLPLKLTRAITIPEEADQAPGTILNAESGLISCGHATTLKLLEVHPAGRKNMAWPDFCRGHRLNEGERFIGRETKPGESGVSGGAR